MLFVLWCVATLSRSRWSGSYHPKLLISLTPRRRSVCHIVWPLSHGLPPPSPASARVSAARCPQSADHLQRAASEALLPAPVGTIGTRCARLRWHRRVRTRTRRRTRTLTRTRTLSSGCLLYSQVGTAAFAASGCLVAGQAGMDTLGCCFIGTVTALGGGTVRDVLLGRWRSASP